MSHVTTKQIRDALASRKPVWSRAAGRVGRVIATCGRAVEMRSGANGKGQICLTTFESGDDVIIRDDGHMWIIENDWDAVLAALPVPVREAL